MRSFVTLAFALLATAIVGCATAESTDDASPETEVDAHRFDAHLTFDARNPADARPGYDAAQRFDAPPGCVDQDGDQYGTGDTCLGEDCDDNRANAHPGAAEICNGDDDDCDNQLDEGLGTLTCGTGACLVSVNACVGGVAQTCTPGTPTVETCDGTDDDCDFLVDEDGVCQAAPANDDFADSIAVTLGSAEVTVTGTTLGATHDAPAVGCGCTDEGDVWYRFTVVNPGPVYIDTAGSGFDTSLIVTDSTGAAVAAQESNGNSNAGLCNDDASCGTTGGFSSGVESRTWGYFAAGTYHVAVGGCEQGDFVLNFQYLDNDSSYFFYTTRISGASTATDTLIGTSVTQGTCTSDISASGEDARWFTTCGSATGQFFSLCVSDGGSWERSSSATSGTGTYDATMYLRSARTGAQVACNDDGATAGGTDCRGYYGSAGTYQDSLNWGSRINNAVAPRGLNEVFVDSRAGGSGMGYTLVYTIRD